MNPSGTFAIIEYAENNDRIHGDGLLLAYGCRRIDWLLRTGLHCLGVVCVCA